MTNPEVPRLVQAIYRIPAPKTPRDDLVEVFLTGVCKACGPVKADLNSQLLNKDVDPKRVPAQRAAAAEHVDPAVAPTRTGSVSSAATSPASRTAAAWPTTSSTSRCRRPRACCCRPPGRRVDGLGDEVNTNNVPFRTAFPYVALPNQVAVNQN